MPNPLPSHKLVKASVHALKHIPTGLSEFTHIHTHVHAAARVRPSWMPFLSNYACFSCEMLMMSGECCNNTYLGDQPRHLTRYSTLPWESEEEKLCSCQTHVKRQYFSTAGAFWLFFFANTASLLPCGCASFRCPPPQRHALQRQGAPFSLESDHGCKYR